MYPHPKKEKRQIKEGPPQLTKIFTGNQVLGLDQCDEAPKTELENKSPDTGQKICYLHSRNMVLVFTPGLCDLQRDGEGDIKAKAPSRVPAQGSTPTCPSPTFQLASSRINSGKSSYAAQLHPW